MNLLLLNDGKYSTKEYSKQLAKWGITLIDVPFDLSSVQWSGKRPSEKWIDRTIIGIFQQYQFSIDGVQMLFTPDSWKSSSKTLRGSHFGQPRNGYEIGIIKYRRSWEDSGRHELMHAFDDFVYTYTGVSLARVAGVDDWDEDVVHGASPRFKEYEYDHAYRLIASSVRDALIQRDKLVTQAASVSALAGFKIRQAVRRFTGHNVN